MFIWRSGGSNLSLAERERLWRCSSSSSSPQHSTSSFPILLHAGTTSFYLCFFHWVLIRFFSSNWDDITYPKTDVAYPLPELTQMYCPDHQYSPMGSLFFTQPDVALRSMFNRGRGIFELWSLALFGGTCCPFSWHYIFYNTLSNN